MALVGRAKAEAEAKASTRAKWRALPSARSSTLKKYLTPPTLSETPVFNSNPADNALRAPDASAQRGVHVVGTDIRVAESTAHGQLSSIPEEPNKFAEAHDDTRPKLKTPEVIFSPDINVEVFETIVSIKIEPLESAFC